MAVISRVAEQLFISHEELSLTELAGYEGIAVGRISGMFCGSHNSL
jgi:hypothetical protein